MNYVIVVQQEALDDLQEGFEYYQSIRQSLAKEFIKAFKAQTQQIENNPFLFQIIYKNKRKVSISKFQYHIIYEIEEQLIRISAIIHSSRNPSRWKNR